MKINDSYPPHPFPFNDSYPPHPFPLLLYTKRKFTQAVIIIIISITHFLIGLNPAQR
jgi:hypothetical protein